MPETKREWSERDELAAEFMAAIIGGDAACGTDHSDTAATLATKSYKFADAFLTVRENMARKK